MPHLSWISGMLYGPEGPVTERFSFKGKQRKTYKDVVVGKDDDDYLEKTWVLARSNSLFATMILIFDVVGVNNQGGLANVLARAKYHYTPWIGGAIAYTSTVRVASALRGKTDEKNHIAGGFAAGAVVGRCARSTLTGIGMGALLATIGFWYKKADMLGFSLFPDMYTLKTMHGNPNSHRLDFRTSFYPERPSYYARSEEEVEKVYQQGQLGDGNSQRRLW